MPLQTVHHRLLSTWVMVQSMQTVSLLVFYGQQVMALAEPLLELITDGGGRGPGVRLPVAGKVGQQVRVDAIGFGQLTFQPGIQVGLGRGNDTDHKPCLIQKPRQSQPVSAGHF